MYASPYEEHLAHSAPCTSRFDGFDRGDLDNDDSFDQGRRVIGRMPSSLGRVEVIELWCNDMTDYAVTVNGEHVHSTESREQVLAIGRWYVQGCPA